MYRNSAQVNILAKPPLPSPEHTSDSDSDLIDALDRKRRQLDEEISKFKAIKEREFRDFEKDLRKQCKRKRSRGSSSSSETSPLHPGKHNGAAASSASILNLLASTHNASANNWTSQKTRKGIDSTVGDKITRPAPLSKPTLSLDKLNISGETTPPISALGTPPTPSGLPRPTTNRSQSAPSTTSTPQPRSDPTSPARTAPTQSDRFDSFAGVFTPAYLPLLESRDHTPTAQSPQPLSSQEEIDTKQLQLINAESKRESEQQNRKSQSLPQQSVSPTVVAAKRTHSNPQLPSTSLPSALRNSNGRVNSGTDGGPNAVRKRKHVTFQLADSAIVEPSSSYEELPSPDVKTVGGTNGNIGILLNGDAQEVKDNETLPDPATQGSGSPDQQQARNSNSGNNNSLSPNASNQQKGRLRSPAVSPLPSPSPSPTIDGLVTSADESGFSGGLSASADGGSGVGFFELDEELASPAFTDDRSFDDTSLRSQERGKMDDDLFLDEKKLGDTVLDGDIQVGSFTAGSVPINIVRHPTGSWIGSYGH